LLLANIISLPGTIPLFPSDLPTHVYVFMAAVSTIEPIQTGLAS